VFVTLLRLWSNIFDYGTPKWFCRLG